MLKNLLQNQQNLKARGIYSCTGIYFFKSAIFLIFFKKLILSDFSENKANNFPLHIYAVGNSFAIPSYFSNLHEEI